MTFSNSLCFIFLMWLCYWNSVCDSGRSGIKFSATTLRHTSIITKNEGSKTERLNGAFSSGGVHIQS
jgi:hypothetical protein